MEGHKHLLTAQSPFGREEQSLSLPFPTLCLQEWEPKGIQTLGQGGTCSELRNHTTFTGTANVLGESEAQGEAQEAAKEQRRKELKKDLEKGGSEHPALLWACWGSAVFTPNPAPATAG